MLEVFSAEFKGVEHHGELDVFENLGVDGVLHLELEPHHLDGQVAGETADLGYLGVLCVSLQCGRPFGQRLVHVLKNKIDVDELK